MTYHVIIQGDSSEWYELMASLVGGCGWSRFVSFRLAVQFYFFPCYLMKISRFKPVKSGINLSGLMKWLGWSQDHTSEHPSGSLKIVCFVKARGLLLASAWDYKVQWRSDHFLQRKGKSKKVWSRIFCLQHESQSTTTDFVGIPQFVRNYGIFSSYGGRILGSCYDNWASIILWNVKLVLLLSVKLLMWVFA